MSKEEVAQESSTMTEVLLPFSGVRCDGCGAALRGYRYRCDNCRDFDYCQKCYDAYLLKKHHYEGQHSFNRYAKIMKCNSSLEEANNIFLEFSEKILPFKYKSRDSDPNKNPFFKLTINNTYSTCLQYYSEVSIKSLDAYYSSLMSANVEIEFASENLLDLLPSNLKEAETVFALLLSFKLELCLPDSPAIELVTDEECSNYVHQGIMVANNTFFEELNPWSDSKTKMMILIDSMINSFNIKSQLKQVIRNVHKLKNKKKGIVKQ